MKPHLPILRQDIKPGDMPSAKEQTHINRTLTRMLNVNDKAPTSGLRVFRLPGQMGADESSSSNDLNHTAFQLAFNPNVGDWELTTIPTFKLTDPNDLVWDEGYRALCLWDNQAGLRIPINPVLVRHARTVADNDGTYPSRSEQPNVYPIKFTKITFPKRSGRHQPTIELLDASEGPDDWVFNIHEGVDPVYLAEGTDISCYCIPIDGEANWFCDECCDTEENSSSSQSESSSSPSSGGSSASSSSGLDSSQSSRGQSSQSPGPDTVCSTCTGGVAPTQLKVTISGVTDSCSGSGTRCSEAFNGTHIVSQIGACTYSRTLSMLCGADEAPGAITVYLGTDPSPDSIQVQLNLDGGDALKTVGTFIKSGLATPLACDSLNENIPYSGTAFPSSDCVFSGATVTVESL